jgi:hypothetical protein
MSEIYDSQTQVIIQIPAADIITSVRASQVRWDYERPPIEIVEAATYTVDTGSPLKNVSIDIPASLEMADFSVEVITNSGTFRGSYERVVPYATVDQLATAAGVQYTDPAGDNYRSEADIKQIESLARTVIESITGRCFGKWYTAYDLEGTETRVLYSSEPILFVDLLRTHDDILYGPDTTDVDYAITPSGHGVELFEDVDIYYGFPDGYTYMLVGTFGYDKVPADINHAAILIGSTYLCSPASYWNRYVEQTKFGESQTKFNRLAFVGTGNAAADIILQKYQFHRYFVI